MTLSISDKPLFSGSYPEGIVKRGGIAYGAATLSLHNGTSTEIEVGAHYIRSRIATKQQVQEGAWDKPTLQDFVQSPYTLWEITDTTVVGTQGDITLVWTRPKPGTYALYCELSNQEYAVERTNGCYATFFDPCLLGNGEALYIRGFEVY